MPVHKMYRNLALSVAMLMNAFPASVVAYGPAQAHQAQDLVRREAATTSDPLVARIANDPGLTRDTADPLLPGGTVDTWGITWERTDGANDYQTCGTATVVATTLLRLDNGMLPLSRGQSDYQCVTVENIRSDSIAWTASWYWSQDEKSPKGWASVMRKIYLPWKDIKTIYTSWNFRAFGEMTAVVGYRLTFVDPVSTALSTSPTRFQIDIALYAPNLTPADQHYTEFLGTRKLYISDVEEDFEIWRRPTVQDPQLHDYLFSATKQPSQRTLSTDVNVLSILSEFGKFGDAVLAEVSAGIIAYHSKATAVLQTASLIINPPALL